jgi:hypothetical protein
MKTPLGCTVRLAPAPEHLGEGMMLYLTMEQEGDGRHAEVYLSPANCQQIATHIV